MSTILNGLAKNRFDTKYRNPKVRDELEKLTYLIKRNIGGRIRNVDANLAKTYTGDFYGLLQAIGIESRYFWITMRVNDLSCAYDYNGTTTAILIPNMNLVDRCIDQIQM